MSVFAANINAMSSNDYLRDIISTLKNAGSLSAL